MKILAVADRVENRLYENFDRERFPQIDLILACGDLPPEYLTFLTTAFNVTLGYVRGNHDIRHPASPPEGCIDLHGRVTPLAGLRILGLEGSRWYNGGPYQYTECQMRWLTHKLRWSLWRAGGVDCIVTHAPPRHIHDAEDPCHRGFRTFGTLIRRYRPPYFIHGHIHAHFDSPQARISQVGETRVINAYGYHLFDVFPQGGSMDS
jgi:Icc-related predicted phosphoesterase